MSFVPFVDHSDQQPSRVKCNQLKIHKNFEYDDVATKQIVEMSVTVSNGPDSELYS